MSAIFKATYQPPSRLFTPLFFRQMVRETLTDAGIDVIDVLEKATSTWTNKPRFTLAITDLTLEVETTDPVFNLLNVGAQPHTITAKNPSGRLAFKWAGRGAYAPKSKPLSLISYVGQGGKKAKQGTLSRPPSVNHPGFKARRFDEAVAAKMQASIEKGIRKRLDKAFK